MTHDAGRARAADPFTSMTTPFRTVTAAEAPSPSAAAVVVPASGSKNPPADDFPWSLDTPGLVHAGGLATDGRIEVSGDRDLLAVDLQAGDRYRFTLSGLDGLDPLLTLLDPAGETIATDLDSGSAGDGSAELEFTAPGSGRYYLGVEDEGSGTGRYAIGATVTNPAPRLVYAYPTHGATDVQVSSDFVLGFDEPVVAGNGSVVLYNDDGSVAHSYAASDTSHVRIAGSSVVIDPVAFLLPLHAYRIGIDGDAFIGADGQAFPGLGDASALRFTTLQPTDDHLGSTATTDWLPAFNTSWAYGQVEVAGDEDWFAIPLQAGGRYSFRMEAWQTPTALAPVVTLHDAQGQPLVSAADGDGDGSSMFEFTAPATGTYYVSAAGADGGTGPYHVVSAFVGSDPPLLIGSDFDGAQNWPANGTFGLSFSEPIQPGSGTIRIYNSDGSVARSIAVTDTEQVRFGGSKASQANQLTIDPLFDLPAGRGYYIGISPGAVLDAEGKPFAGVASPDMLDFVTAPMAAGDEFPSSPDTPGVLKVGTALHGAIQSAADVDLVRAELVAGVIYSFDVAPGTTGAAAARAVALLDSTGHEVGYAYGADGASARITFMAQATGSHYLRIGTAGVEEQVGSYRITAGSTADDYAAGLESRGRVTVNGTATAGAIQYAGDVDTFAVRLTAGTLVHFDLAGAGGSNLPVYLGLLDVSGHVVTNAFADSGPTPGSSRITYAPTTTGLYYLQAGNLDGSTGAYQLKASTATDSIPASWTSTASVAVDSAARTGYLETAGDADMYKVQLSAGQAYVFNLAAEGVSPLRDPYLSLFGPTRNQLVADDDGGAGRDAHLVFTPEVSGTYYLRVSDDRNSLGAYRLTAQSAESVAPTVTSQPADGAVISRNSANIQFGFSEQIVEGHGNIVLRDASGGVIATYDVNDRTKVCVSGSKLWVTPAELPASTAFYVDIAAGAVLDWSGNPFAGLAGQQASLATAPDDFDASIGVNGTVVAGGSSSAGVIEVVGDRDLFRISLEAGKLYAIDIASADPWISGMVLDANMTAMASQSQPGRMIVGAPSTGTYYISIAGHGTAGATYAVSAAGFERGMSASPETPTAPGQRLADASAPEDQPPTAELVGITGPLPFDSGTAW